jgi:hypothetical protein
LGALAGTALGADEGPIVFQSHEELPTVGLRNVQASLDVLARYQNDRITSPGATNSTTTQTTLQQTIELSGDSWIVHPNLVDLHGAGNFGVEEDFITADGQPQNSINALTDYDVEATFLRKEPVTATVYARSDQQLLFQQFAGALNSTTQSYGGTVDWRSEVMPSHLGASYTQQQQTDPTGQSSFGLTEENFEYHSHVQPDSQNNLGWSYNYNNVGQTGAAGPVGTFSRHDANLNHTYSFDGSDLSSVLSFSDQQGEAPLTQFTDDETLHLRHSKTFETDYHYTLQYQDQPGLSQLYQRGSADFTHRLFESLVTTGGVGASLLGQDPGGQSADFFGHFDLDYHKKVPLGLLSLSAGGSADYQTTDAGTANQLTNNLPFTFPDPTPIILNQPFVNPSSLRITDSTGTILYTPGVDYTVQTFSDHTQITRVLGGRITSGQPVLVSYLLSPQPATTTTTVGTRAGVRYDFREGPLRGLGVYARYANQSQQISSAQPLTIVPANLNDYLAGADYRIWKLTFSGEYEDYAAANSPYTAIRALGRYADRFGTRTIVSLDVNHTTISYSAQGNGPGDTSDDNSFSASAQVQITRNLYGSVSATYIYDLDQVAGTTQGIDAEAQISWHHRQTEVSLLARQAILDNPNQNNSNTVLQIIVKRNF